jgi:hypothetical protein
MSEVLRMNDQRRIKDVLHEYRKELTIEVRCSDESCGDVTSANTILPHPDTADCMNIKVP